MAVAPPSRSRSPHRRSATIRIAAFTWILHALTIPVTIGLLAYGFLSSHSLALQAGIGGIGAFVGTKILALALSQSLNCRVCAGPVFDVGKCIKHPKARRFLGISYQQGIATQAFFSNRFRCLYCGEKNRLTARSDQLEVKPEVKTVSLTPGELPEIRD
ncbi:MAG: hypothetical protein HKN23_14485 [Verrucomicrobiales bacterium]|nr:hypothetical protein [Verrucomicrobiales bacterium]